MKNRIIYLIIAILIVSSLIIVVTKKFTSKGFEVDGVRYAIHVNGSTSNSFPTGNYTAIVRCTNATGYWDSVSRKIIVKNIRGNVICDIDFTSITSGDYLNNYLIANGSMTNDYGDYRFKGTNPSNYVLFNNELWRIIGVFDQDFHGASGQYLVKLIRDEPIGVYQWNNTTSNDWVNSNLKTLLNGAYYNHTTDSTNCHGSFLSLNGSTSLTCDFTTDGIQTNYQGMIQNATWNLGGYTSSTIYYGTGGLLEGESETVYSGNTLNTTAKIGLMYSTDFICSVYSCHTLTDHWSWSNTDSQNTWLYNGSYEWSITHNSGSSTRAWQVGYSLYDQSVYIASKVRPVLYLVSSVYRVDGSGSITDPYIIGKAS